MLADRDREIVSSTEVSKTFGKYLRRVKEHPIFVARNRKVEAVLLDIAQFEELLQVAQEDRILKRARSILRQMQNDGL